MRSFLVGLFVSVGLVASASAQGVEIWAVQNLQQGQDDPGGGTGARIIRFNAATPGTVTKVGNTGVTNGFVGLDFDRAGSLYGLGRNGSFPIFSHTLFSISTANGVASSPRDITGVDARFTPQDLAFDPVTNQMLLLASGRGEFAIYSVNNATGAATLDRIFPAAPLARTLFVGLSVNSAGVRFVHDSSSFNFLLSIAPGSGSFTTIPGTLGNNPGTAPPDQGMGINWRGGNEFYGALFETTAQSAQRVQLRSVNGGGLNPTGGSTLLGSIGTGVNPNGLTYVVGDIAILPSPGAGSVLLIGLAMVGRRRR